VAGTITNVTGTLSDGNQITISGSNFGSTGPTVLFFENGSLGTNGQEIQSASPKPCPIGAWDSVYPNGGSSTVPAYYSNAYTHSPGCSVKFDQTIYGPTLSTQFNLQTEAVFASYWVYMPGDKDTPGYNQPDGPNWKHVVFIYLDETESGDGYPKNQYVSHVLMHRGIYDVNGPEIIPIYPDSPEVRDWASGSLWYDSWPGALAADTWNAVYWNRGCWHRFDFYIKCDAGTGGILALYQQSSQVPRRTVYYASGGPTIYPPTRAGFQHLRINAFARQDNNSHHYWDDMYISGGP